MSWEDVKLIAGGAGIGSGPSNEMCVMQAVGRFIGNVEWWLTRHACTPERLGDAMMILNDLAPTDESRQKLKALIPFLVNGPELTRKEMEDYMAACSAYVNSREMPTLLRWDFLYKRMVKHLTQKVEVREMPVMEEVVT